MQLSPWWPILLGLLTATLLYEIHDHVASSHVSTSHFSQLRRAWGGAITATGRHQPKHHSMTITLMELGSTIPLQKWGNLPKQSYHNLVLCGLSICNVCCRSTKHGNVCCRSTEALQKCSLIIRTTCERCFSDHNLKNRFGFQQQLQEVIVMLR